MSKFEYENNNILRNIVNELITNNNEEKKALFELFLEYKGEEDLYNLLEFYARNKGVFKGDLNEN